jgi:hypothetical protein
MPELGYKVLLLQQWKFKSTTSLLQRMTTAKKTLDGNQKRKIQVHDDYIIGKIKRAEK